MAHLKKNVLSDKDVCFPQHLFSFYSEIIMQNAGYPGIKVEGHNLRYAVDTVLIAENKSH